MSQFDFGAIDPDEKTGVELANDLNSWRNALHTTHRGTYRPAYAQSGTIWIEDSATSWKLYVTVGSGETQSDILVGIINTVTNKFETATSLGTTISQGDTSVVVEDSGTGGRVKFIFDGAFTGIWNATGLGINTNPFFALCVQKAVDDTNPIARFARSSVQYIDFYSRSDHHYLWFVSDPNAPKGLYIGNVTPGGLSNNPAANFLALRVLNDDRVVVHSNGVNILGDVSVNGAVFANSFHGYGGALSGISASVGSASINASHILTGAVGEVVGGGGGSNLTVTNSNPNRNILSLGITSEGGRPIFIQAQINLGSASTGTSGTGVITIYVQRNGNTIAQISRASTNGNFKLPLFMDFPSAGAHTYSFWASVSGNGFGTVTYRDMFLVEIQR